jgi:hypothetical protein
MTTLAQIGDFHARPDARNADRYRVLGTIVAAIKALAAAGGYGGTFWPGDLNHAKMTIADKNALRAVVQQLAEYGPVFICRGNHDEPGDLDFLAHIIAGFPIYVITEAGCVRGRLATGEFITVFAVPYPDKGRLVGANVAPGDIISVATELLTPIFMQASIELAEARAHGDLTAMIGHFNVRGSRTSAVGQPNIGKEIELSGQHLDLLGPIFKGLNHIHFGQEIAGAWYAGSTYRQDYGEVEPKRFLLIDIAPDSSYAVRPQLLDIPPMHHVEGLLDTEGFHFDDESQSGRDWTGCDLRVRYRYHASERPLLDERKITVIFAKLFGGALRAKIEAIAIPDRDVRAPEVAAATTLAGKVAAYKKLEALDPETADALARLEHADAAQLLAEVDAQLAALEREADPAVAA